MCDCLCISVGVCLSMNAGALEGKKRVSYSLESELQAAVTCLTWNWNSGPLQEDKYLSHLFIIQLFHLLA